MREPANDKTPYLTAKDIAKRWQVNVRTVERKLQSGELPAKRFGPRIVRVRQEDLEAYECALNDRGSTESRPPSGTSSGPKADARVAFLQRRMTA